MSLKPIFPQFAAACAEFIRPEGFPRPFAALDWCPRCSQPDWAHQSGTGDRIVRLHALSARAMSDMLEYLCEYSPGAFDTILYAVRADDDDLPYDDHSSQESGLVEEPYCVTCGTSIAIFAADGTGYRHYRESDDGDCERFTVDHPTVIGYRQPTDVW